MSGTLPTWLEHFFGVDPSASGEGTIWRLDNAWPWIAWVSLLLVLFIIVLVVAVYAFEAGRSGRFLRAVLIALRLAAIGVVLFMIGEWTLKPNPTQLPYLVVLVDDSESMKLADR